MSLSDRLRPGRSRRGDLERRLVWMVGSPRTGTTWLLNLLGADPRFVKMDEPGIGVHLGLFLHEFFGSPARNFPAGRRLMTEIRGEDDEYFFAESYADVWRPALRELLHARFQAHLDRAGSPDATLVIKEPNGSQAMPLLLDTLPGSRVLWVVRDGRDVVDSKLDGIRPGGWIGEYGATPWEMTEAERLRYVEDRSYRWLARTELTQEAYERLPEAQRMLVRYEDLRADTAPWLERIVEWLSGTADSAELADVVERLRFEKLPADQRGAGKFTRAAKPGGWRDNLRPEEHGIMERIMGAKLRELGYE